MTSLRQVQVGVSAERNCPHCHRKISCTIQAVGFVPRGPPGGEGGGKGVGGTGEGGGGSKRRGGKEGGGGVLVVGQPLPSLGTCRHYRHSHR